jgi:hypothetical protein
MKKIILLAVITPLLFGGCRTYYAYPVFEIDKVSINKENQIVRKESVFENDQFSIILLGTRAGIMIDIENKTDTTLSLVWDESALIDIDGYSHKIVHGSTRRIDVQRSIVSTPVFSYSKMMEVVYRSDEQAFFPRTGKKRNVLRIYQPMIGNSMKLNLLFRSEAGDSYRYIFDLKIKDVKIR